MNNFVNNIQSPDEVTRYIFDKSGYARTTGRVKYNVLMPNSDGETSVFWITNLSSKEIWDIGQRYVAERISRTLRARGDLFSSNVLDESLEIKPETKTHPRHANIVGWPTQKSEKILIAKKLAENAQLHMKP